MFDVLHFTWLYIVMGYQLRHIKKCHIFCPPVNLARQAHELDYTSIGLLK